MVTCRRCALYDDTAIDKMVKSVNRIIQSDKMVD